MALTQSTMKISLGTKVPDFTLPSTNDYGTTTLSKEIKKHSLFKGAVIVFTCNHCPFAKHVADQLATLADEYLPKGIHFYAISSNDTQSHPDDSPDKMKEEAEKRGFHFPYLFDEDQSVAKAYHASCTPDFYAIDGELALRYRGQMDTTRPNSEGIEATGADLRAALDAICAGNDPSAKQTPSLGCSIKWKPGNEPAHEA